MKNCWIFIAIVGLLSLAAGAQSGTNGSTPANAQTPKNSLDTLAIGTSFHVELTKTLDVKKVKIGDAIQAKVTEDVLAHDTILVPKGSKLVGSVAGVQAHTRENVESTLKITFEKFVLKDGRDMAFLGEIEGYYPPTQLQTVNAIEPNDDPQGRAAGPVVDNTGRVYNQRPKNQSVDLGRTPNMQRQGAQGTHLSMGLSSTFSSSAGNVKLDRGTVLLMRTKANADPPK
jgi:hypothetical protein